jgi:hypothetical protein
MATKQTPIQAQQAQATAAINGTTPKANGSKGKAKATTAPAPAITASAVKSTVTKAAPAPWTTVTVTAATPAYSVNRATPMDIAYDAARINGVAILRLDGKADKMYVRCADGVVRSAKSPLAVEALTAHAKA